MKRLLPDQLKQLWQSVEQKQIALEEFTKEQDRLLGEYRDIWAQALRLEGQEHLEESLLSELGMYLGCHDLSEIRNRCLRALANIKGEWHEKVGSADRESVEQFYNESEAMIYELMWWHALNEDNSPLAYVLALEFAGQYGCRHYLDFGAGVGSGSILFARHGLDVTMADISSAALELCRYRFGLRGLPARYIDLKEHALPENTFDIVAAMDVFEHLVDPVDAVDTLWRAMKPGGFLFGRFHSEVDEERPHHIVQDFAPTLDRLHTLGFTDVWRDEWLWGHQVFQKSRG